MFTANELWVFEKYIKEHLSEKRFKHSLGVRNMAVNLAMQNETDPSDAAAAALLHDLAKEYEKPQLFLLADQYGIEVEEAEKRSPGLLHGPVAAEISRELFQINDEPVLNAIRYHTTGRLNMNNLEKIVYVADKIEENRNFKGIEYLREQAKNESLDHAMFEILCGEIKSLVKRQKIIDVRSIVLYNELRQKEESFE